MIQELIKNIKEKDAPIVVGLDPMLSYVPEKLSGSLTKGLSMRHTI